MRHLTKRENEHLARWAMRYGRGFDSYMVIVDFLGGLDEDEARQLIESRSWPEIERFATA